MERAGKGRTEKNTISLMLDVFIFKILSEAAREWLRKGLYYILPTATPTL